MKPKTKKKTISLIKRKLEEYGQYDNIDILCGVGCIRLEYNISTHEPKLDLDSLISINSAIAEVFPKESLENVDFYDTASGYIWEIPTID